MNDLEYIIIKPRNIINLNLFEAERYESAVLVQQLIGNLVYYSNFGRYEPRLASSWIKKNDHTWEFKIKKNLKTESGEDINAKSFKKSIERSLYIFEKDGGVPILSNLVGFGEFIKNSKKILNLQEIPSLPGLIAESDTLTFVFDKPVSNGLLQILSFSPFGYISIDNFNEKGGWKDNSKFISSGPYKVEFLSLGKKYILIRNEYWLEFSENAPQRIIISHDDSINLKDKNIIIDAFTNEYRQDDLIKYKLVPEYINSILIGNYENGFFKDKRIRQAFKNKLNYNISNDIPLEFGVNTRSTTFYPNQVAKSSLSTHSEFKENEKPEELIIEGDIPIEGTSRWYAWLVLKKTLENLKWKYKFAKNESNFSDMTNRKYDLRIRGSSIGGGVEAWGLFVAFCSSMGINFPDPDHRVCNLLKDFEDEIIDEKRMTENFFEAVNDEAAILPVSHYGVSLFLSSTIKTSSISPLLAIVKFDKVEIQNEF